MSELSLYKLLKKLVRGKASIEEERLLENMFYEVNFRRPLGETKLTINLKNREDFLELLNLSEDDIWFYEAINSTYDGYDFYDYYIIEEMFKEGNLVYDYLDDDNIELLRKISYVILPSLKFNLDNSKYCQDLSEKLIELFNGEISNILSEFHSEKENQMNETARYEVNLEVERELSSFGFTESRNFKYLSTTAGNLLQWFAILGEYELNLEELIKKIFESRKASMGNWHEDTFSFERTEDFDKDSFNRVCNRDFESMLEKIENNYEISSFIEMVDRISKKFKPGTWYNLPKNKKMYFKIEKFVPEKNKILISFRDSSVLQKKEIYLSEDLFYKFLYQPTLFGDL